jgi:hypothetical protein
MSTLTQMITNITNFIKTHKKAVVISAVLAFVLIVLMYSYLQNKKAVSEPVNAVKIESVDIKDNDTLQKDLDVNKQEANDIIYKIDEIEQGKIEPVATTTIKSENLESATNEVVDKINNKDTSLPKEALEKTDKTIVTDNPNQDYDIGVYKIDLEKDYKLKVGQTIYKDEINWAVGYQHKKLEVIIHGKDKVNGVTAMYTVKEW